VILLAQLVLPGIAAAATAREMYEAALDRETPVRAALTENAPASVASDGRAVVAAYQAVVRAHPASGYSDNALWQAGRLSIDLYLRFGESRDRAAAVRALQLLRSEYPSSSLLRQVPGELARLERGPTAPREPATRTAARPTPPAGRLAAIRAIRREVLPDAVRVTIELDGEVSFHDERISNPVRVFLDLPSTRLSPSLDETTLRYDGDNELVRQIRIGTHPNNVTRVVLEAAGVSTYSVYPLYNPYRLVIDSFKEAPRAVAISAAAPPVRVEHAAGDPAVVAPASVLASMKPVNPPPVALPAAASAVPAPERSNLPSPAPAEPPPPVATAPPAKNAGGGYSMARQLGLSVSRIVIDPGHGGHDPGATGRSINESELVLDIALRVEKLLEAVPDVEVILTRRTDEYVPLQERTAIANREGADLFLSIHANASANSSASGVETYFLNFATNMSTAAVAARENAASGQAMGALPDFLKQIALNNKLDESRDFATAVQTAMIDRLRRTNRSVKDLGVKQAPFVVLIGAAMPSVLAEVSFVTNAQEARLLRGSSYRQRIAEALVNAIRKYQGSLKSVPRVAQQR
jgi:N-acetylmuramoyl-L-alanine amidase